MVKLKQLSFLKKNLEELLTKYYSPSSLAYKLLLDHGRKVAAKALQIADLNQDKQIDREFLYQASILHDIGVYMVNAPKIGCFGDLPYIFHGIEGRKILEKENLPHHALVCERHVGLGLDMTSFQNQTLPYPKYDMKPQTIEEKIICFADKFFSKGHSEERSFSQLIRHHFKFGINDIKKLLSLAKELNYPIPFKKLNFADPLPDLILSGQKTTTWRIDDEKDLQVGDLVKFFHDSKAFAESVIHQSYLTSFSKLTSADWDGHEKFENETKMYQTYQKYYQSPINNQTKLKVIKYYLLSTDADEFFF